MKTKYILKIKFDSYTGNFHKEFNSYIGYCGEYGIEELIQDHEDYDGLCEVFEYFHDEYGCNVSKITGKDCQEIHVYFEEDPMEFLDFLEKSINSFPNALLEYHKKKYDWEDNHKKIKVLSYELTKQTIKITEEKIVKKTLTTH